MTEQLDQLEPPPDPEAIAPALRAIRAAILDAYDALKGEDDLDTLLRSLAAVQAVRSDLGDLASHLAQEAAPRMPAKNYGIERVAVFVRGSSSKTETDWSVILDDVQQRAVVTDEGEVITKPAVAVARFRTLLELVASFTPSKDAKVKGMQALGYVKRKVDDGSDEPDDDAVPAAIAAATTEEDRTEWVTPDGKRARGDVWRPQGVTVRYPGDDDA